MLAIGNMIRSSHDIRDMLPKLRGAGHGGAVAVLGDLEPPSTIWDEVWRALAVCAGFHIYMYQLGISRAPARCRVHLDIYLDETNTRESP